MLKRYLYTLFGLICLLGLYLLTLLPILAVRPGLENTQYGLALLVWALLAILFFPLGLAFIVKKVWFFLGQGEPVVLELLLELLLKVNELDAPVTLNRQGKKIMAGWRYQEPHWSERMEKSGMTRLYELWLSFDNHTKTVTMTDRARKVNWDLSPIKIRSGWRLPRLPYCKIHLGDEWGVENYEDTIPQDYTFREHEIKSPILNTVRKNGWNVRFSLF